jgi:hypothetical protein
LEESALSLVAEYAWDAGQSLFLIWDLDGTLVAEDTEDDQVVIRPGAISFLQFARARWPGRQAVFTAASPSRAQRVCARLADATGISDLFVRVWTGERTQQRIDPVTRRPELRKPLDSVAWSTGEGRKAGWTKHNTLLLDNTPTVGRDSVANLLVVPTFLCGSKEKDQSHQHDDAWARIRAQLEERQRRLLYTGSIRLKKG